MKILITGAAGFVGTFLAMKFIDNGDEVVGLDNINDYYDVELKYGRLGLLGVSKESIVEGKEVHSTKYNNFIFLKGDLENYQLLSDTFKNHQFEIVCNLAAQAGVRYSIENPRAYINSNISGFLNILECCRYYPVKHLVYASSSSVYGLNKKIPFSTSDMTNHPVSLYAASKKSNELMAHTYSNMFKIPSTGLRFFTVYGPWGRPDMAYFLFAKAIRAGDKIQVFNNGDMKRDFTYIDDIVEAVKRICLKIPVADPLWNPETPNPSISSAPYKLYNIGNSSPVRLLDFINAIENAVGIEANKEFLPMQKGDVELTYADVEDLERDIDFKPNTSLNDGIGKFIEWYKDWYK